MSDLSNIYVGFVRFLLLTEFCLSKCCVRNHGNVPF